MDIPIWLESTTPGSGDKVTLGGILGNGTPTQHPEENLYMALDHIDRIQQTYANLEWVKARRLETRPIHVQQGSAISQLDFVLDDMRNGFGDAISHNTQVVKAKHEAAKPLLSILRDGGWAKPEGLKAVYDTGFGMLDKSTQFAQLTVPELELEDAELPALTPERVVELAQLAIRLIRYRNSLVPFDKQWTADFTVRNRDNMGGIRIERAFTDSDSFYYDEIGSLYGSDSDETRMAKEMCDALANYSRDIERNWLEKVQDVDAYIRRLLCVIYTYIDASVK